MESFESDALTTLLQRRSSNNLWAFEFMRMSLGEQLLTAPTNSNARSRRAASSSGSALVCILNFLRS